MKVDGLFFERSTYKAFLKVVTFRNGYRLKVQEYVWATWDDPPNIENIDVYVLDDSFKYQYAKKKVIER